MVRPTIAQLQQELEELRAQLTAAPAPVAARSRDGRDFPCTAAKPCSRKLRSAKRASIHGVEAGGHEPR